MEIKVNGLWDLSVQGEIYIIRLMGSWNLESNKAFFESFKKLVLQNSFIQFGTLVDLTGLEGGSMDCIGFFEGTAHWTKFHGQMARAQVTNSVFQKLIAGLPVPTEYLFPIENFDHEKDAMNWLKSQGLKIS